MPAGAIERKVKASISAQSDEAAGDIETGVNDFAAPLPFPYMPDHSTFGHKLLLDAEIKTMVESLLKNAFDGSAVPLPSLQTILVCHTPTTSTL